MIIWINGLYGIGKTTVAEALNDGNAIVLDSDFFYRKMIQENYLWAFGACLPNNNENFLRYFRKTIEEYADEQNKDLIISMAVLSDICRLQLFDKIQKKYPFLHIILTANKESLLERIDRDVSRDKTAVLDIEKNSSYLKEHFNDALWIDTSNITVNEIVKEINYKSGDSRIFD